MVWGIPTDTAILIHTIISLIAIAAGLFALYAFLTARLSRRWTAFFLGMTVLTSVTGFPLPPFGFDPPRAIGILSLVLLAIAIGALYHFRLAGQWRWIFLATSVASLYLNVFVGVVQSFQKLAFLQPFAPTQSEPPFLIAQIAVLGIFIALGIVAIVRFHPDGAGKYQA
jgi:hypothetical protein